MGRKGPQGQTGKLSSLVFVWCLVALALYVHCEWILKVEIYIPEEGKQLGCVPFHFFLKGYHLLVGDRIFPYQSAFFFKCIN